jgi:hypothetical protein
MNKIILSAVTIMLMGGSAIAGDVIAPPITKYVEAPIPPKRPTNFGKTDNQKVAQKIQDVTTRK